MTEQKTCAGCGLVFDVDPDWSDEDAALERDALGWANEKCVEVCDECYALAMRLLVKTEKIALN